MADRDEVIFLGINFCAYAEPTGKMDRFARPSAESLTRPRGPADLLRVAHVEGAHQGNYSRVYRDAYTNRMIGSPQRLLASSQATVSGRPSIRAAQTRRPGQPAERQAALSL